MEVLNILRQRVKSSINLNQHGTACYWADKLVSLGQNQPRDLYLYANALFHNKHYHRVIVLLTRHQELMTSQVCRYLAAQAYFACGELEEALGILGDPTTSSTTANNNRSVVGTPSVVADVKSTTSLSTLILPRCQLEPPTLHQGAMSTASTAVPQSGGAASSSAGLSALEEQLLAENGCSPRTLKSSISLLKGKIYEVMENRQTASQCYQEALAQDVTCYEALEKLVHFQAITQKEEVSFLADLDLAGQLEPDMLQLAEFLYKDTVIKQSTGLENKIPPGLEVLEDNVDVITNKAERLLDLCDFHSCHAITSRVMQIDPYNPACLPIHVSVLKELNRTNDLFDLSHKLMAVYPSNAISWFTVGCYYLSTHRNETARRHFLKSCQLDRRFGPAWLALGHAFAADGEHDQAIASYCTAAQIIRGSHIPIMNIGIEYSASNNRNLAERFLRQAHQLNRTDPFILHELGTLAFEAQRYSDALNFYKEAYEQVGRFDGQMPSSFWEPLINNMAHTYRKLGMFPMAIKMHLLALRLLPECTSTMASLALVYAMTGKVHEAIDQLHRALSLQPAGDSSSISGTGSGSGGTTGGGSSGSLGTGSVGSNASSSSFAATMLTVCVDLLTRRETVGRDGSCSGREAVACPPPMNLKPVNVPGSMPGSHRVRFRKPSVDISTASKSSCSNALRLDVVYLPSAPTDSTSRGLLDSSDDEDVTMELG